jgi:hypothetical protein
MRGLLASLLAISMTATGLAQAKKKAEPVFPPSKQSGSKPKPEPAKKSPEEKLWSKSPDKWLQEEERVSKLLTAGQRIYTDAMQKPEPLPVLTPAQLRQGLCGYLIADMQVLKRGEDLTASHVLIGTNVYLLKSSLFVNFIEGDKFRFGKDIVAVTEQTQFAYAGETKPIWVLEEVDPEHYVVTATLIARDLARRKRTFETVGEAYFKQLSGGKAQLVKGDGTPAEVAVSELAPETSEWLRKRALDDRKLAEARQLEKFMANKAYTQFRSRK